MIYEPLLSVNQLFVQTLTKIKHSIRAHKVHSRFSFNNEIIFSGFVHPNNYIAAMY